MTDVSIIIPVFNRANMVLDTLNSIASQEYRPLELIVVDDGSTDATSSVVNTWAATLPEDITFKLIRQNNGGGSAARNAGLSSSNGKYVMFLDSDDLITDDLIAGLVKVLDTQNGDIAFGPMDVVEKSSGARLTRTMPDFLSAEDLVEGWILNDRWVAPCSVLWRSDYVRKIGAWDTKLRRNEDGEIVLRAVIAGACMCLSDKGSGIYVAHQSTDRVSTDNAHLQSMLDFGEIIVRLPSEVVHAGTLRRVMSRYFYELCGRCYLYDRRDLGDIALRRSRDLGFAGHTGTRKRMLLSRTIGVRRTVELSKFLRRFL